MTAGDSDNEQSAGSLYAAPWDVTNLGNCHFYHTLDIPGHGTVEGHVDLRPNAAAYVGNVDPANCRVLEFGPASGFVTFELEARGAREVVALEVSDELIWQLVPQPEVNLEEVRTDRARHMADIKRGFWLAHRAKESRARVVYGDAAAVPRALGRFDIAVLGGVLLHCRDPLAVLGECADVVDDTIVITEQEMPALRESGERPIKWLAPSRENKIWDVWWRFTPGFFAQALPLYGFANVQVIRHDQLSGGRAYPHFTVVGRRSGPGY